MSRRRFGRVRKLPSGRWQARYRGPDGVDRPAPHTFDTKTDADLWLTDKQVEIRRGGWIDPDAGSIELREYGAAWLTQRPGLSPTTLERYEGSFRLKIVPGLGNLWLSEIDSGTVRRWHTDLLSSGTSWPSAAKAYRVLRAMLNTAIDDELIVRNPCRIKGADNDRSPERPVLTVDEVTAVVSHTKKRYQLMVLMAAFTTLRLGELAALRRCDVDVDSGWVYVRQGQVELSSGKLLVKRPKSEAGKRRVGIPTDLLPALRWHLDNFSEEGSTGRVFVGPKGGYIRRQNFRRLWVKAAKAADITDVHFHDLRGTGNTLAAASGANLRELMERMGHTSTRAAVIYLHSTNGRDRQISDAMNVHLKNVADVVTEDRTGT